MLRGIRDLITSHHRVRSVIIVVIVIIVIMISNNLVKFKRGLEEELVPPTSRQQGVSELTNFAIEKNSIYTSAKITALPSLSGNCTSIFII